MLNRRKLKGLLCTLLAVCMIWVSIPITSGAVTNSDGYIEIRTIEDLYNVRNNLAANYILMNDIDLTEATAKGGDWDYSGNGWNPIGSSNVYGMGTGFSGIFDGNGHSIIGIRINTDNLPEDTYNQYVGLFSYINGGTVKNLTLTGRVAVARAFHGRSNYIGSIVGYINNGTIENCHNYAEVIGFAYYTNSTSNAYSYTGGIAGYLSSNVNIINCSNHSKLSALGNGDIYTCGGGIAGNAYSSNINITKCYNTGDVISTKSSSASSIDVTYAGGILGRSENSSPNISNCYNTGDITVQNGYYYNYAYGISNLGKITNCYNTGMVSGWGNDNKYAVSKGTVTSSYFLTDTGKSYSGAQALTDAQMRLQSVYKGFDFTNTWIINPNATYPYPQLRDNIQDMSEAVKSMHLISLPVKTAYRTGDKLDLTGALIEVTYASGESRISTVTADMISGYDPELIGTQTLTVTYKGFTDSFEITVTQRPEVNAVYISSQPAKKEFVIGTAFDFSGTKLDVGYSDGTVETITVTDDMISGGNINRLGKQTITVTYGGKTDSFEITVVGASIESIVLTKAPDKLVYKEGESLDLTGMKLSAVMNNGKTIVLDEGYTASGFSSTPGTHRITVTYLTFSVSFDVTVADKAISSIEITAPPSKLEYFAGEELDLTGMIITAKYTNGDTKIITEYTVSGYDTSAGIKAVTVEYQGKTAAFTVKVTARSVESIEITRLPAKLIYIEGESFDAAGMTVTANYTNGTSAAVSDYTVTGFSSLPGTHTVSVSYGGHTDSFTVTVEEKKLVDIVITPPHKLEYIIGEEFDSRGLKVTAKYSNGQDIEINSYKLSGFESLSEGIKTVYVTYGEYTRCFTVSVHRKPPVITNGKIEAGSVTARPGESVSVPVSVSGNTGLSGFKHTVRFDVAKFKYVDVEISAAYSHGTFIVNSDNATKGEITVVWFDSSDLSEDGVLYTVELKVREKTTECTEEITLEFADNDHGNSAGQDVIFTVYNGSINVVDYILGDLDCDRVYSMADILLLAQYLSGKEMDFGEKQLLCADVNEDGNIDIHDVTLLSQWLAEADI